MVAERKTIAMYVRLSEEDKNVDGLVKVEIEYVIRELIDILLERSTKVASGKAELFM